MTAYIQLDAAIFFIVALILTAVITHFVLPVLRKKKIGQTIYEEGPKWHMSKQGTPTMGGICFIMAILVCFAGYFIYLAVKGGAEKYIPLAMTLALGVGNGLIGFVDDYAKLVKKQNQGLTEIQKIILQSVVAVAYVIVMAYTGNLPTSVLIPFTSGKIYVDLWYFAYPIYALVIVAFVNATNITDGIDGLAASVTFVIAGFLIFMGVLKSDGQLTLASSALAGAMVGFLIYNFNPAKIFMGDTGSLFIGGILMGMGFSTGRLIVFLIIGLVYIVEITSSFLQRYYYKFTHGKRLFKMAPIHHHFEKCGWSEKKIVFVFSGVTLLLCVLGGFGW